jgi:hypothetical protein
MKPDRFPEGWDADRVRRVLEHYESQTEDEAVAEDGLSRGTKESNCRARKRRNTRRRIPFDFPIDRGGRIILPAEHRPAHCYCFYLHDYLVTLLIHAETHNRLSVSIPLKSARDRASLSRTRQTSKWDWMIRHGYAKEMREVARRQIVGAVLSDFCHFLYEALTCISKAKLSVGYALLRKVLKDDLFVFEWLLAEPEAFLDRFFAGSVQHLDVSRPKDDGRRIIRKAARKTLWPPFLTPREMYRLRFERKYRHGFHSIADQAIHLVTTFKGCQTAPQNLNLVFSSDEDRLSQWNHVYSHLPELLHHAVNVIEALFSSFGAVNMNQMAVQLCRRVAGWWWCRSYKAGRQVIAGAQQIVKHFGVTCEDCGSLLRVTRDGLGEFFFHYRVRCLSCGSRTLFPDGVPFGLEEGSLEYYRQEYSSTHRTRHHKPARRDAPLLQ